MQHKTDEQIVGEVLMGNQSLYAELVKRHQRFVFTLAFRFSKSREDAEEIAQDCFIKAYRALSTYKHNAKFSTWLYSITYTTSMSFLRKKRMDTVSLDDKDNSVQIESHISAFNANLVERKWSHAYLNKAIEMLGPEDAAVITLFYKGEQSLEEIGVAIGLSENTVKVRLHRARLKLKEKLEFLLNDEVKELI